MSHVQRNLTLAVVVSASAGLIGCGTASQSSGVYSQQRSYVRHAGSADVRPAQIIVHDFHRGEHAEQHQPARYIPTAQPVARRELPRETRQPVRTASPDSDMLPPNARPGECYARVYIPEEYETIEERILLQEASERVEILPAEYEWVEEEVLVKEASEELEVIPAEYDWVEEEVLVTPASKRIEEVPARHEWVEEQVLVKPAQTVWKKGRGPIESVDNGTGEIMCLVEMPAEYKTVRKQVQVSPATTREIAIPAEHKTIRKKIMVRAPSTRTIEIPAEYQTVRVKKMVRPEQQKVIPIDPEYQTVSKEVLVREGRMDWKRVLCETNMSRDLLTRVQEALSNDGYTVGDTDGMLGPLTQEAIKSYQREHGLAVGGLTYETLSSLGLSI